MPNYVQNRLIIKHEDNTQLGILATAAEQGELFNTILPCPEGLIDTPTGKFANPEKQAAMIKRQDENYATYGYSSDYQWRVENWGCKWEASDITNPILTDSELVLEFLTAWAPPTGIFKALREQGYDVEYDWSWED